MPKERKQDFSKSLLKRAVESGDAMSVILHAADADITIPEFKKALADTLLVISEKYEKDAKSVNKFELKGTDRAGSEITLMGSNSFELKRAKMLRKMAARLLNS